MIIFVDESGIHKQTDHASFVLVYIQIFDYSKIEKAVRDVEDELEIEYFHWAETPWIVKEQFMDHVLKLDFKVKIAIIKNPINFSDQYEKVLTHMIVEHNIRNVNIDGKKPKRYERRIKKILRDKGISVKKLRTGKDEQFPGLRIADMVAGLSRSYFDKKSIHKIKPYYERLKKKIIVLIQ